MSTYGYGYELLDLTLQEDGTFGADRATLLDLNVFDDQGLGAAGMTGVDPDMQDMLQDASVPRELPPAPVVGEKQEILAVELTQNGKHAVAFAGGIALGLLLGVMFSRGR